MLGVSSGQQPLLTPGSSGAPSQTLGGSSSEQPLLSLGALVAHVLAGFARCLARALCVCDL
eukprot:5567623-Pyramimonas_sp.AAC.1